MSRADIRRAQKEENKKNAIFTVTREQLDTMVKDKVKLELSKIKDDMKREIAEEAENTVLALTLALPIEVLKEFYWTKSYKQRIPAFVDKLIEYYGKWQDGELDMEKLKKDLWETAGVRLEAEQV